VSNDQRAEVGIVGAGFAGLSAALTLRRHRTSILVLDGGPSRNRWAREVHGYPGVQGVSGEELRGRACEQVLAVGGEIVQARVERARREGEEFVLEDRNGQAWRVRRVLLATGLEDVYPDIDNFFDFYGKSVFACPHCDAFEVRDQPVAIVAWNRATLPFAREVRRWTNDLTIVTDGRSPALTTEQHAALAKDGIAELTQTVERFEGQDGQVEALRFASGSRLPVRAVFFNIGHRFQNDLARQIGCQLTDAACVQADEHLRTTVPGVWVAGDLAGEEQQVAIAVAHGLKAGIDIYRSLTEIS
jgi:thioredoxin reductase